MPRFHERLGIQVAHDPIAGSVEAASGELSGGEDMAFSKDGPAGEGIGWVIESSPVSLGGFEAEVFFALSGEGTH